MENKIYQHESQVDLWKQAEKEFNEYTDNYLMWGINEGLLKQIQDNEEHFIFKKKELTVKQIIDRYSHLLSDKDKKELLNNNTLDISPSDKLKLLNGK